MDRPRLSEAAIERIRRERYAPRVTQCDYLHLSELKLALAGVFAALPERTGPVLDLFCGTQPYRDMVPFSPVWGFDVDSHFGRADVVGGNPLPFADGTFSLVLCTQALHLVDDPAAAVLEMARVLQPGGTAIVTVPHIFRKEIPQERRLSREQMEVLFTSWHTRIDGFGSRTSAAMYAVAGIQGALARRWAVLRLLGLPVALIANGFSLVLAPFAKRQLRPFHASWMLVGTPHAFARH